MECIKIEDVISAVKGKLLSGNISEKNISSVAIDSREKMDNGLFIAIKGENTDGHKYIANAAQNGAIAVIVCDEPENYLDNLIYIQVEDSVKALQNLAEFYRSKFSIPVVGITGSVGKTTTKDMISSVLATKYKVLKTEGNFNSEIGVPLTIFRLNKNYEIAVVELGMDHMGEISNTGKVAKPDSAVITNVGVTHIEHLKTRENILKAKCEIFENLSLDGVAILNADDDMLATINNDIKKIWFGKKDGADIQVKNIYVDYTEGKVKAILSLSNTEYNLVIPGISEHLVYAAMSAIAVGLRYGLSIEEAIQGVANYTHTKMRMDIYKLNNNVLVIDDTYNANPDSMKSLINTVNKANVENKILILGDMFELGSESKRSHIDVLEYALKNDIKIWVTGDEMKQAVSYLNSSNIQYFLNKQEIINNLDKVIIPNSIVALKASRGMKFENITEKILENY